MRILGRIKREPRKTEAEMAAERWAVINAQKAAEGCRCGRPGTRVRWFGPSGVWSCDEHYGVNSWTRSGDDPWVPHFPTDEEARELSRWETPVPRPYTDVDRIRKGTS